MQTVNFQCGACGKLMAVGVEFLGQQVRCPHCQQVVVAPPANTAPVFTPPPEPAPQPAPEPFTLPQMHTDHEDIFSQRSETEDALFGHPEGPRLEVPREREWAPAPPLEQFEPTHADQTTGPVEQPVTPSPTTQPAVGPEAISLTVPEQATQASEPLPWAPSDGQAAAEGAGTSRLRREQEARRGFGHVMFVLLVFIPTLLWAIGATAIGVWLYLNLKSAQDAPSMWKEIPDAAGDDPGIRPVNPRKKTSLQYELQFDSHKATRPLPDDLKVALGSTLTIGDLEVTPFKVRRQRMRVTEGGRPEPLEHDSLVLYLRMKSLADNYAFTPLDNYFDRQWKGAGPTPLTILQALDAKKNFFGGPVPWISLTQSRQKGKKREWLEGRKNVDRTGLLPGEEMESFVCTDGSSAETARFLFGREVNGRSVGGYHGPLLWRVHLRRGRITRNGKPYSATAVIGVELTDKDYTS